MLLGLFDPVLFLIAGPVLLYFVCLGVALAGLFSSRAAATPPRSEQADTELKASLRRYAAWRPDPIAGEVWLSRPSRIANGIEWMRQRLSRGREAAAADMLAPSVLFPAREPATIEPVSDAAFPLAIRPQDASGRDVASHQKLTTRVELPLAGDHGAN